jgi:hypothetical protein
MLTFGDSLTDVSELKPAPHNTVIATAHATTHKIEFRPVLGGGHCSATAVGPQALLTASHCEAPSNTILIDGTTHHVMAFFRDDFDHTLFMVDETFPAWAKVSNDAMQPGDDIFIFGNPSDFDDLYRKGTVGSYPTRVFKTMPMAAEFLLDINGFPGDSGAGIFNTKGELVGVVSFGKLKETTKDKWPTYKLMGGYPLQFPDKILEAFVSGKVGG